MEKIEEKKVEKLSTVRVGNREYGEKSAIVSIGSVTDFT